MTNCLVRQYIELKIPGLTRRSGIKRRDSNRCDTCSGKKKTQKLPTIREDIYRKMSYNTNTFLNGNYIVKENDKEKYRNLI